MERDDDDVGAFCCAVLCCAFALRDDDGIVEMDGGKGSFGGHSWGARLELCCRFCVPAFPLC